MTSATATRSDEQIQRDVLEELKWDARVQPNEIAVSVTDGVVALTGWADSYAKKWAAEQAAHRVRGVVAVANDIEVRLPSSAERTDTEIAAAVTRALEWDAFVPIDKIDVTVSKGWVTLSGFPNPRIRSLLARWRQDAVTDMAASARRKGANAVVGMRFDHRDISQGWVEICAYGTAVVIVTNDLGRRPKRGRSQPNPYRGGEVRWWATT